MQIFIISHYEKVYRIIIIMTIKVDKILVDFDPYTETNNIVTRKCYRCKQVKDIDCFKRCYCAGKHSITMLNTLRLVLVAISFFIALNKSLFSSFSFNVCCKALHKIDVVALESNF